jgi:hypothetical protein
LGIAVPCYVSYCQNEKFTEEEMHNYRMAVTEREVDKASLGKGREVLPIYP